MIRAIFGGLGVVVGAVCLILLAAKGQLWTTPFRWDFQNGPGLGAFVLISGLFELRRAFRNWKARKKQPPSG